MKRELRKRNIKLFCENTNTAPVPKICVSFDSLTKQSFFLDEKQKKVIYKTVDRATGDRPYTITLNRKHVLDGDFGHRYYFEFGVYDDLKKTDIIHDDPMANAAEIENNKFMLELEKFLKRDATVSWKDKDGKELNTNCKTAYFRLVDEEALAEKTIDSYMLKNEAMTYLNDAFKSEDKYEFLVIVYGFGLGHYVETKTRNELFPLVAFKIEQEPKTFLDFIKHPDRELEILINMAVEGFNGIKEMSLEGVDTYKMGDIVIGSGIDGVKAYLKGNVSQLQYLRSKYPEAAAGKKKEPVLNQSQE